MIVRAKDFGLSFNNGETLIPGKEYIDLGSEVSYVIINKESFRRELFSKKLLDIKIGDKVKVLDNRNCAYTTDFRRPLEPGETIIVAAILETDKLYVGHACGTHYYQWLDYDEVQGKCHCDIETLMAQGCICGNIRKYQEPGFIS